MRKKKDFEQELAEKTENEKDRFSNASAISASSCKTFLPFSISDFQLLPEDLPQRAVDSRLFPVGVST
jgi:hypothetical protein